MKNVNFTSICVMLAVGLATSIQANARSFSLTQLGSIDGTSSMANAINDRGQVVGVSDRSAVVWNGTTPTLLSGLFGGDQQGSYATGINDAGQIVGVNSWDAAAAWNGLSQTPLDRLLGAGSNAWGINNAGTVVGMSDPGQAVEWSNYAPTILSSGAGKAYAINNAGVITGCICSPDQNDSTAVVWHGTAFTVLGGQWALTNGSAGLAINDRGQVAGYGVVRGQMLPVIWNGTTPTILPTLNGADGKAKAINDSGEVVGTSGGHAVLWNRGSLTDLNQFLGGQDQAAGWYLETANDINNAGVIVGNEVNRLTGATRAFEISAVPEPTSVVLALAGLGLLVFVARRNHRRDEKPCAAGPQSAQMWSVQAL